MVRVAALTTAAIIPKSRPPCQFRLWQGGFFLAKMRSRKLKKLPEKSRGAFYFAEYARNCADFVVLLCLKIYLVPAQALAAPWTWDSVPAPLKLQLKALLFLLIFHHRCKFFYGFYGFWNSFLFLRMTLRNSKKTLNPRSLPYFRHFFPVHVG